MTIQKLYLPLDFAATSDEQFELFSVILFVMEIINILTDSILLVLHISTFKSMAMNRMSVEFSIVVVEVMHINRSLTYSMEQCPSWEANQ